MLKTKEERVKEGITLLKKLKDAGVPRTSPSFTEVQKTISKWVVDGAAVATTIPILRSDRDADIVLPANKGQTAQIVLRMIPGQ